MPKFQSSVSLIYGEGTAALPVRGAVPRGKLPRSHDRRQAHHKGAASASAHNPGASAAAPTAMCLIFKPLRPWHDSGLSFFRQDQGAADAGGS